MSVSYAGAGPVFLPFISEEDDTSGVSAVPHDGYAVLGGAANDVLGVFLVPYKCKVHRAMLSIMETFACDATAPVFYFDKADVGTIPTEDGDVAIITVPDAQAAGSCMYDDAPRNASTPIELNPGDWVVVSLQTDAADAGTVAGKVFPQLLVEYVPETAANISDMTETA
jgi:hypothetical protein